MNEHSEHNPWPTLPELLEWHRRHRPQKRAIVSLHKTWSYRELVRDIVQLAGALRQIGVKRGDRVAVLARNHPETAITLLACGMLETIIVLLSFRAPAALAQSQIQFIRPRVLIGDEDLLEPLAFPTRITFPELWKTRTKLAHIPEWQDDNPHLTMIFTSGSTGEPKVAVHSWANHYFSALGSSTNIAFTEGHCWLVNLPLYHIGGVAILFRALLGGGAIAFLEQKIPPLSILQHLNITHISMVSTQLKRFLKAHGEIKNWRPLECVLLGGGPIPPVLVEQAYRQGLPLFTTYGSTEMSSQITTTAPDDSLEHLQTAGRLLPFRELQLDGDGNIQVKGKTLFQGYWKDDLLERPVDEAGWFHTGDVGMLTSDGYLRVEGRRDNMFISGGENIHPETIEAALVDFPEVHQAVVVPVPHPEFGFRPVAFVDVEAGWQGSPQQIREKLRERLPGFMIPEKIWLWPATPQQSLKPGRRFFQQLALQMWQAEDKGAKNS